MSGGDVVWEAPAPTRMGAPPKYALLLEEVKERPGSWARIRTLPPKPGGSKGDNNRNALNYARRRLELTVGVSDERWEFKVAPINGEGSGEGFGLYARYRTPEMMEAARKRR